MYSLFEIIKCAKFWSIFSQTLKRRAAQAVPPDAFVPRVCGADREEDYNRDAVLPLVRLRKADGTESL